MLNRSAALKPEISADAIGTADNDIQSFDYIKTYAREGRLPWRRLDERKTLRLVSEVSEGLIHDDASARRGETQYDDYVVNSTDYSKNLYNRFHDDITTASTIGLRDARPDESAYRLLSPKQKTISIVLILITTLLVFRWPLAAIIGASIFTTIYFLSAIVFRLHLFALGRHETIGNRVYPDIPDRALPVITILLPLYRDAEALPALAQSIDRLDYPAQKKDVKLLLEADDLETIAEANRLGLDARYDMIVTPDIAPKTKPKACNFGLFLSRGDLIVIYDAEDQPERDQLRKAAAAFQYADETLACVQARLNYYNHDDNWLTRLFTLEYSLWFDWLLPSLQYIRAPIPLGGTSNFFRCDILEKLGGWDPFNVTEDADLGLRIAKHGFRVELLDSTTFEEANCRLDNWIRQRSRWMKGYLQTWLVHMRRPGQFLAATGWRGFLAVQLFVAGNFFSALINPIMWALSLIWLIGGPELARQLFPDPLLYTNLAALTLGNGFFVAMMVLAPLKRGRRELCIYGLTTPFYWLLTSLSAYKSIWQALTRLHYWEKTNHMISDAARRKRQDALAEHF